MYTSNVEIQNETCTYIMSNVDKTIYISKGQKTVITTNPEWTVCGHTFFTERLSYSKF